MHHINWSKLIPVTMVTKLQLAVPLFFFAFFLSLEVCYGSDKCQTLMTDILVTREKMYEYNGRRTRMMCVGEIKVSKCEGTCVSQVSPSIVNYPGFKKDCKCCRESTLHERDITLENCYDGTTRIPGQIAEVMIKEPNDCQCQKCLS